MELKKLLTNIKNLYRKTFDLSEEEINFDSFTKLSLFFFRLILLDLQPLSENATLLLKVKKFGKKCLMWLQISSVIIGVMQLSAYGFVHPDNFFNVMRAISDSSMLSIIVLKAFTLFLHKSDIQVIIEELKTLFENRANTEKHAENKKYHDGYHRIMKICLCNFVFGNLAAAAF